MTEQELERLLQQKCADPKRKNISLVISPQIVRTAAHLKKRRQDRIQMLLCALSAAGFLIAGALIFFFTRDFTSVLKYAGIAAGVGMLLTLLCAPALILYEEDA